MFATLATLVEPPVFVNVLALVLPSFDGQAAATVGFIVAAVTVLVLVAAIATPFIALAGGASIVGTALAIGGIALVTGAVAGTASGFYWGQQGDLAIARNKERVIQLSNHLDICFDPAPDDKESASPFRCTLLTYEEAEGSAAVPVIEETKHVVAANDSHEFYSTIDTELRRWFGKPVLGDDRGLQRVVTVYMKPFPGDAVWDRLQAMVQEQGGTPTRTDGPLAIRQVGPVE